jgi:hypothetical protein
MRIKFPLIVFFLVPVFALAQERYGCDAGCLEKKALLGDGGAALSLGDKLLYEDRDAMKNWYRISAENGSILGAYNYAHFLAVDSSSLRDCYRAIYWFGVAAKRGHKLSKKRRDLLTSGLNIGNKYEHGCSDRYSN